MVCEVVSVLALMHSVRVMGVGLCRLDSVVMMILTCLLLCAMVTWLLTMIVPVGPLVVLPTVMRLDLTVRPVSECAWRKCVVYS